MPTIFAASESSVLVNGDAVEGVRSIDFRHRQGRENIFALGSSERIGMVSGPQIVEGRLVVSSTSPGLDALGADETFQISAQLRHGETEMLVTFDECHLQSRSFNLEVGSHGEAIYEFVATRMRQEIA